MAVVRGGRPARPPGHGRPGRLPGLLHPPSFRADHRHRRDIGRVSRYLGIHST